MSQRYIGKRKTAYKALLSTVTIRVARPSCAMSSSPSPLATASLGAVQGQGPPEEVPWLTQK